MNAPAKAGTGLARSTLVCWLGIAGSGCLDEAPTFELRDPIPPFVIAGQVDPPLGAIYRGPIPFSLHVPFRSEDVNVGLEARVYLDLVPGTTQSRARLRARVPPGNFEDLSRSVTLDWTQSLSGCHSLTLILTYTDNYDDVPVTTPEGTSAGSGLPRDDSLAARVVWWLDAGEDGGDATFADCPTAAQPSTPQ